MVTRDLGKLLLALSGIVFIFVVVRLGYILTSYSVGFDLLGIWKSWRGWIMVWLLVTAAGFTLLALKRP